jgi:hypothetical protein
MFSRSHHNRTGSKMQQMDHEFIGMLSLNTEGSNDLLGKIAQVRGHDDISPSTNRRCQNMPVFGIRKL